MNPNVLAAMMLRYAFAISSMDMYGCKKYDYWVQKTWCYARPGDIKALEKAINEA